MTATNAILAFLGTVFGGGGIFLGIFGRKKTQAEAETEAIKGSGLVVEMYERLASRYEVRIKQLEDSLDNERLRCNGLENEMRTMSAAIRKLQGEL